MKRPPGSGSSSRAQTVNPSNYGKSNENKVSEAVRGKLDQLERLQYQLTKADINQTREPLLQTDDKENQLPKPTSSFPRPHRNSRPASPPVKLQSTTGSKTRITSDVKPKVPAYVEQSSTSSSSFKVQGHPAGRQREQSATQKYIAPAPKRKQKSNLAWIKKGASGFGSQTRVPDDVDVQEASRLGQLDENSLRQSLNSTGRHKSPSQHLRGSAFIDSMDLGSSIQDVWKMLDNQPPSLDSSAPDQ